MPSAPPALPPPPPAPCTVAAAQWLVSEVYYTRYTETASCCPADAPQRQCFFNSIWNKEHIKSLHISWKEDIDTEGRGGYFDEFGIIRDIVQNHLLQLFIFSCMDQPSDPSAEHITAAKVAFLQSVQTLAMQDVVLGQFEGYLSDETVPEGSKCPTYAAVSLAVDNETWKGVPMMITAGKGLSGERAFPVDAPSKLSRCP